MNVHLELHEKVAATIILADDLSGSLNQRASSIIIEWYERNHRWKEFSYALNRLTAMKKDQLIQLLRKCYEDGKVSLCTFELPRRDEDSEIKKLSEMLAKYKSENECLRKELERREYASV